MSVMFKYLFYAKLTLNDHITGLDGDLDALGNLEQFLRMAMAQLSAQFLRAVYWPCLWRAMRDPILGAKFPTFSPEICGVAREFERVRVHVLHLCGWRVVGRRMSLMLNLIVEVDFVWERKNSSRLPTRAKPFKRGSTRFTHPTSRLKRAKRGLQNSYHLISVHRL